MLGTTQAANNTFGGYGGGIGSSGVGGSNAGQSGGESRALGFIARGGGGGGTRNGYITERCVPNYGRKGGIRRVSARK